MAQPTIKKLEDRFFIIDKTTGNFLDKNNLYKAVSPFDDNVYVATTEAEATALKAAQHLTTGKVTAISRFV